MLAVVQLHLDHVARHLLLHDDQDAAERQDLAPLQQRAGLDVIVMVVVIGHRARRHDQRRHREQRDGQREGKRETAVTAEIFHGPILRQPR